MTPCRCRSIRFDANFFSFEQKVLPALNQKGIAAVVPATAAAAPAGGMQAVDPKSIEADGAGSVPNPVVPNFPGKYGEVTVPDFEAAKRPMGSTGLQVSILGMGGYHLGTASGQVEVNNMVAKALDHGINFFDNAWEYHKGISEERVGTALKGKRDRAIVMTKVCTHGRKKEVAMKQLEIRPKQT